MSTGAREGEIILQEMIHSYMCIFLILMCIFLFPMCNFLFSSLRAHLPPAIPPTSENPSGSLLQV